METQDFCITKARRATPIAYQTKKYRQYLSNHAKQNQNTSCENHHDILLLDIASLSKIEVRIPRYIQVRGRKDTKKRERN